MSSPNDKHPSPSQFDISRIAPAKRDAITKAANYLSRISLSPDVEKAKQWFASLDPAQSPEDLVAQIPDDVATVMSQKSQVLMDSMLTNSGGPTPYFVAGGLGLKGSLTFFAGIEGGFDWVWDRSLDQNSQKVRGWGVIPDFASAIQATLGLTMCLWDVAPTDSDRLYALSLEYLFPIEEPFGVYAEVMAVWWLPQGSSEDTDSLGVNPISLLAPMGYLISVGPGAAITPPKTRVPLPRGAWVNYIRQGTQRVIKAKNSAATYVVSPDALSGSSDNAIKGILSPGQRDGAAPHSFKSGDKPTTLTISYPSGWFDFTDTSSYTWTLDSNWSFDLENSNSNQVAYYWDGPNNSKWTNNLTYSLDAPAVSKTATNVSGVSRIKLTNLEVGDGLRLVRPKVSRAAKLTFSPLVFGADFDFTLTIAPDSNLVAGWIDDAGYFTELEPNNGYTLSVAQTSNDSEDYIYLTNPDDSTVMLGFRDTTTATGFPTARVAYGFKSLSSTTSHIAAILVPWPEPGILNPLEKGTWYEINSSTYTTSSLYWDSENYGQQLSWSVSAEQTFAPGSPDDTTCT